MIEDSEKLKSSMESRAEHLADRLVPYSLLGTAGVWLLTRNVTKALSVLMVDFSCALKLAMPLTVLSAIREAGGYGITVKGGKFLEAVAEADTVVFDKDRDAHQGKTHGERSNPVRRGTGGRMSSDCSVLGGTFPSFYGKGCSGCGEEASACS